MGLLLVPLLFLIYIFYPRNYKVASHKIVPQTKYWNLSTGSALGYVHRTHQGLKRANPIIYLHGGPGGAITESTIDMLSIFLTLGHDVYAYDQVGSGSSERLKDITQYTVERHIADLDEIIRLIGSESVILLGQSWGGVLATYFAKDHPDQVQKIILTGPGPIFPINHSLAQVKAPDSLNLRDPKFSNQEGNKEVYTFRDKCIRWLALATGRKLASDEEVDNFFTHLNNSLNRSGYYDPSRAKEAKGGGGYYAHIMTMKSLYNIEDPRESLRGLKIPTLILKGQYDNQKWGFTKEYLDLLENASLEVIPKAGHFIFKEQPDLYNNAIHTFLSNSDTP